MSTPLEDQRWYKRLQRIKDAVPVEDVLSSYGYRIRTGAGGREQQFACDLHGDGLDQSMSARAYGDHTYCFACSEARDHVDYVMIKEDLSFSQACTILEKRYGLPPLPWSDELPDRGPSVEEQISSALDDADPDFDAYKHRIERLLMNATHERDVKSVWEMMKLWGGFDKVVYLYDQGKLSEALACAALDKLRLRTMEAIKEHAL